MNEGYVTSTRVHLIHYQRPQSSLEVLSKRLIKLLVELFHIVYCQNGNTLNGIEAVIESNSKCKDTLKYFHIVILNVDIHKKNKIILMYT